MDRSSFMRFLGVAPGDGLADKNTIWDFKKNWLFGSRCLPRFFTNPK